MAGFFREGTGIETLNLEYPELFKLFAVNIGRSHKHKDRELDIGWDKIYQDLPTQTAEDLRQLIKENISGERPDFESRIKQAEQEAGIDS